MPIEKKKLYQVKVSKEDRIKAQQHLLDQIINESPSHSNQSVLKNYAHNIKSEEKSLSDICEEHLDKTVELVDERKKSAERAKEEYVLKKKSEKNGLVIYLIAILAIIAIIFINIQSCKESNRTPSGDIRNEQPLHPW